uniref:Secreted protein n=1 Tax=Meloidogyne hapla TaxID=6305 RepID=A0A1I8BD46_MELHA
MVAQTTKTNGWTKSLLCLCVALPLVAAVDGLLHPTINCSTFKLGLRRGFALEEKANSSGIAVDSFENTKLLQHFLQPGTDLPISNLKTGLCIEQTSKSTSVESKGD